MTTRCIRTVPDGTGYRVSVDDVALPSDIVESAWSEAFPGQKAPSIIPTDAVDSPRGRGIAMAHDRLSAAAHANARIGWEMTTGYILLGDEWQRFYAVDRGATDWQP